MKNRSRKTPLIMLICVMLFVSYEAIAQQASGKKLTISGIVMEANDPPIPLSEATISIKGSGRSLKTEKNGNFNLNDVPIGSILVVTYTGFKTQEVPVHRDYNNLIISLVRDLNEMEQVVVTGVAKQKVKEIASSVSTVDMENVVNKPVTQLSQALQGGTTGISVNQSSGVVGSEQSAIRIRGVATMGNADPLVLVDGVPFDMNNLDPNSVASISVLKDAAAASMYGSRGANGVILITTKRGVAGRINVDYNGYYGVQKQSIVPNLVDGPVYMRAMNQLNENMGSNPAFSEGAIDSTARGLDPLLYPNTNWWDLTMRESIPIQQHSVLLSGGNTASRFVININHLEQSGQIKNLGVNNPSKYSRTSARINSTVDLTRNIMIYTDLFASRSQQAEPYVNGSGRATGYLQDKIYAAPPTVVGKYPFPGGTVPGYIRPGTEFYGNFGEAWNPVGVLEQGGTIGRTRDEAILNIRPQWQISPNWSASGQVSYTVASGLDITNQDAYTFFDYYSFTQVGSYGLTKGSSLTGRNSYFYWGGNVEYKANIGADKKHNVNAILGYTQELRNPGQENTSAYFDFVALQSYSFKGIYSYDEKYLLEVGMRRDGSSLFGPGNKWGNFPSVAVGWNIDQEAFMDGQDWLMAWKLRASYGILGNNRVRPYLYQTTLNGNGTVASHGNANLRWEKLNQFNIGTDLSLKAGLDITVEWYNKNSEDLLLTADPLYSSAIGVNSAGGGNSPTFNAASANVKGLDASIKYFKSWDNRFGLNLSLGYSTLSSKVLSVGESNTPIISGNTILMVGGALREFYGYRSQGLLQQADIDNENIPKLSGAINAGDIKYIDKNGDGKIDANDRVPLGTTQPTKVVFGNIGFNAKGFDFDMLVNYQAGSPIFYQGAFANPFSTNPRITPQEEQMDTWAPENTGASLPRFSTAGVVFSDFWQEKGDFVRIRYMQLGYTLPESWLSNARIKSTRVYFNAQNPFTFSDIKMIDPETARSSVSTENIAPLKIYTFGLSVKF
ncbi:SusC/RagA family TonB-linked outer membrane protein [Sphingobacterium sp. DK4209]|uniref:SusC/RagA family TonB-linked outer membrane protein n=1 Tax=Sphingobacterium zhuxiongii TaxID=2662364 RepID=A0A5Q0Q944_9SPHI|nr:MULTISPECIES: SusC/RagA family TonB-linked outer membrane protein [unclassified Sphingobacterium]MVZ66994.1 SusC/RagA family TonB-linked outer membrane protein [Sphingobacterium sp. DK4209]QGA25946.1 SusC/RagA family TonB-linked outer membrane protein [Sphingobacterium sp. dk4302]